ncbi:hypothetical protein FRB90_008817, partial [Tulasnella sp. 427]
APLKHEKNVLLHYEDESWGKTSRRTENDPDQQEDTVENQVKGLAEKIIAEDEERRNQELDLFNIAPKRPNWDLKRNLEKKLSRLERKTAESIHLLIRKRMAAQQGTPDDLSAQISAQQRDAERDDDEASDEEE